MYVVEVSTGQAECGPGRAEKNFAGRAGNFGPVDTSST